MALTSRHRWCMGKIVDTFSPAVDENNVQDFIRKDDTIQKFNTLFSGKGPKRLFVLYQKVLKRGSSSSVSSSRSQLEYSEHRELFLSDGLDDLFTDKCCYFLRVTRDGIALDASNVDDGTLLYGEMCGNALKGIEAALSRFITPMLQASDNWGQTDNEQQNEFMAETNRFTCSLREGIKSQVGGLELLPLNKLVSEKSEMDVRTFTQRANQNPELVPKYEQLLSQWCDQIENYLKASPKGNSEGESEPDLGPRGEIQYWRGHMQRLTSITEQLKHKDCKVVIGLLSTVMKSSPEAIRHRIGLLLQRWKQIDIQIAEAANEAKDNAKYLSTLERFIDPLYSENPLMISETLPALLNAIHMIYTISRYYNTEERMMSLLIKVTHQMIETCKKYILKEKSSESMWEKKPQVLVHQLEHCLKLNEAYQTQYRLTKAKLAQSPEGKQFDFDEIQVFDEFDLFCRRAIKLVDMFSTVDQFHVLSENRLEGMGGLILQFQNIERDIRSKRHDLLAYHNNRFDRDYIEFNVRISELEGKLQQFINESFENITSIEHSLKLLRKFQGMLQRESLKSDLDSKLNIIFQNYGIELEQVQQLYEKQKCNPPLSRNLPPVAGSITWSRHLLKRIEEPMKHFQSNQNVLAGKNAKRIIKMYNRVARTLIMFEVIWYNAWLKSIDQAQAGLQATLVIRHPDDGKLYVNLDQEILQLIREAKCLDRMGLEIPESAKIALYQEETFKSHYYDLHWALTKYDLVLMKVNPVTATILGPHFSDMEYKLRPGMTQLTWTSMNIDRYKSKVHGSLLKLLELVGNINDIVENRIEKNLKILGQISLVDLPYDRSFNVLEFVDVQTAHIESKSKILQGKSVEILHAVEDLIKIIKAYPLDDHLEQVGEEEVSQLKIHYNQLVYQALLYCAKNAMDKLKNRIKGHTERQYSVQTNENIHKSFFEVSVQLEPPARINLMPSLEDIQDCVNKSAQAILDSFKHIKEWPIQKKILSDGRSQVLPREEESAETQSFYHRISNDSEIEQVALLLTGCIQEVRDTVQEYLKEYSKYDWLWKDDKDFAYAEFLKKKPSLEDFEQQLKRFMRVNEEIELLDSENAFGALTLKADMLKGQLKSECGLWKRKYCKNLHHLAKDGLECLVEYMRVTTGKLKKEVNDLDSLRFMMNMLKEVRARESGIDAEIGPILSMYRTLEYHLAQDGSGADMTFMEKGENDKKTVMRSNWTKLIKLAESRADELSRTQIHFKRGLIKNVRDFKRDVVLFRADFIRSGPMVQGVPPMEAVERLHRFKEEYKIRERKYQLYSGGEELFALPHTDYPDLEKTNKELKLSDQLYGLYVDVLQTLAEWKQVLWTDVVSNISTMTEKMDNFSSRCKVLPAKLREWDAYKQLRDQIEDFLTVLPLLQELSKKSIMPRHWNEVMQVTKTSFELGPGFSLQTLLEIGMVHHKEEIEEITEGADKQLKIQTGLQEIVSRWQSNRFIFIEWKTRGVNVLKGTGLVMEELEEAQMNLQTMLSMRHVAPFREEAQAELQLLSDTSDTLERWLKVQMMWCSLESVFTGGDIAKQMPVEAKKFAKVDKDWAKLMQKSTEIGLVTECCAYDPLRSSLGLMYSELEKCQKSLEGYLEQKRSKFPRFYFVSNPGLLVILSQGSDPLSMNEHYEKVFDAIASVTHNKMDKTIIEKFNAQGSGAESIKFSTNIRAQGNIEDWLCDLLMGMQLSIKDLTRNCSVDISNVSTDISGLRSFVDRSIAQMALLGIQLLWTSDVQTALDQCKTKKNIMKETNARQLQILHEMSSWCLQDLGSRDNRTKIETLVTIHVHQRDVINDLAILHRQKKIQDANDFEWLKQARFYWRNSSSDETSGDGACVISITDVDFNYQYEYLGSKERLVITPLTDRCYITLAQALGMYFGGAPAGPAGTGKTESVKDLGRALGIFVVVTNCTDQQKYTDCAKIFKGLCQGGLWGCFDEFNRILLPVLSVVAQQVLAIQNAKKTGVLHFQFPGDPQNILLKPVCGFFITMNPGYAGRQELPENLKALFRGVAMMVPDFQIIMKVKLCSVGYTEFDILSQKFFVLYNTCKEQLSAQKHYDWGLRNILAVLRTAGQTKRSNVDKPESFLMYRTLRDMNLSKLVAQDVPLFLSLLADLFPALSAPPKGEYPDVEAALAVAVEKENLVLHQGWVSKVIQLYETTIVRHGIMLVGPTGGGKTKIFKCLRMALEATTGIVHKDCRFNPKAIRAPEMYGEIDSLSGEWTTGVFAAMWAKFNNRNNAYNTWIIADGPVDAIWIEDLNTVLDDNKILTLANGDRIPMTDNVKAMFEVETLVNASPATVSRAGIIFVSDTDLDWSPVVEAWIRGRPVDHQAILRDLFKKWLGVCDPTNPGHCIDFLNRNTYQVMGASRVGLCSGLCDLFTGLVESNESASIGSDLPMELERLFLYSLIWSVGGLLEFEDRVKFDFWLRERDTDKCMPKVEEGETAYEYFVRPDTLQWQKWAPPHWKYPNTEVLDFSNLLVPTMDSTRALYLLKMLHKQSRAVLMVGAEGTAKTSTALMFFSEFDPVKTAIKRINFSSATTPFMCQNAIEVELDKRGGKNFGPPGGKKMTIFMDDLSMPEINAWGDQPTLEMVRLIVEWGGFCFLDKDKRGDFKVCEDLQYVAAMGHPGAGKNDIPNRLKRNFFAFNLVLPSMTSINDIYGQMLSGRFNSNIFDTSTIDIVSKLTSSTISLWRTMKSKMLPTPAKFHYIFNMRDLSRVFQGILLTPKTTITTCGGTTASKGGDTTPSHTLANLWRHECERVFCDKLTNNKDKTTFQSILDKLTEDSFGRALWEKCKDPFYMVNFMRDDEFDDDGVLVAEAPKVYEPGGTLENIRARVTKFMNKMNEDFPAKKLELVLFADALKHLLRLNRLLEMPRGSALLVGVGGSGKQSLTRLASYISRSNCFQVTLTKQYNVGSFMDDLRLLYKSAGHQLKQTTFLFTESEIKNEVFLELINSILMTGEVPGLFAKDEMLAMTADLRNSFLKNRPGMDETQENLKQYFIDCVRDNLHLVLCMSPLNPMFPIRARKFPGLISGPTIDWFLPWPEEALVSVSRGLISDLNMECDAKVKDSLMCHMGVVHKVVTDVCDEYFNKMRRHVYQTPKSYLSFIQLYKKMYGSKLNDLKVKEGRLLLGLNKLIQGAEDVAAMKIVLKAEQKKLEVATTETMKMLESLEVSSAEAKKEGAQVSTIKQKCVSDAERIAAEKHACEADLAKAQPFVDQADTAISSIKPAHIQEVKKLPNPADIIKLVFDCVLLLFNQPMLPVKSFKLLMAKQDVDFIETSFKPYGLSCMSDPNFLKNVISFGQFGKDKISEETIEFLVPYMELEFFNPQVAKNASAAAEGLCTWVTAMKSYHEASKIVKPKLEALSIAEAQMEAANKALAAAESRLEACQERLNELQSMFDNQMATKRRIEDGALSLQRKMSQASELIDGLAGERVRWTEDSEKSTDLKRRLVGDCALASAFVSYCGPFNQEFRGYMIGDKFSQDLVHNSIPFTKNLDIIPFLVDIGTIGDWNMQGLPTDPLSIQNGILVTRSSRFPLMIDPQGQANRWIRQKEMENMPTWGTTTLNDTKLRDKLEFCMSEGKALIILGVENDIDPMLDPVLEKQITMKGKKMSINVSDKNMEYDPKFMLYFISRLPNPSFSPELQAKVTLVDFTVTQKGLEEQLLGRVIGKEQQALEDQLSEVLGEVNSNTKALLALDASLLERLTSNTGNLLDDEELIGVLANTKAKAADVNLKLVAADETRKNINEKREQFRSVATRGSVLYFAVVEMSLVNVMYQTSLDQFLKLFMGSMDKAEKATLASKRVTNIIDTMTYMVYRYINCGLYEKDKLIFVLLITVKILITASLLKPNDLTLFLRGGAALDINSVRRKPFSWLSNESWLNIIELSQSSKFFANLPNDMTGNESMWRRWYEDNEPESVAIPDYEARIQEQCDTIEKITSLWAEKSSKYGPFNKLLLVRSLRMDRTILTCKEFIRCTSEMGTAYVEPVTDTMEMIFEDMVAEIPVIFLLSIGADPTESIETLARKKKLPPPAVISLGEGQEPVAILAMNTAAGNGTWVLLQNCELGLGLMNEMEDFLGKLKETGLDPAFRLFITALPHREFPLGLLQMSKKVTNEPPAGLKAGILRSYTVIVDQERLERVEIPQWRQLLFGLCFLHSVVQERRKFGPLGWCIPYEYNNGDLTACILFLEKHLYNGPISWSTFQYMVSEVQYGGKITDDLDRRMFKTYTQEWLTLDTCAENFSFNPSHPIFRIPKDFNYCIPRSDQIGSYKDYVRGYPEIDTPEIFGLHPNADLTFRVKEVNSMFSTLDNTQPKGGGGGGGISREDVVYEKAQELLSRLPEDYIEDEYKVKLQKLGGLTIPLNIFLFQEIQRLQRVIAKVRYTLTQLQLALKGEVVMSEELQGTLNAIYDARVAKLWTYTIAGDEFSWVLPTLGLWFSSLIMRDEQSRTWLNGGRPNVYWLTGFFNPQGMLTAMKQEVTRRHKSDKWALDDVIYHTEITAFERVEQVRTPPPEGVYIHGLFIDGAAWSKQEGCLVESAPKVLFTTLPVMLVSANTKKDQEKVVRDQFGVQGPYICPVYKYATRTDRFRIFYANLKVLGGEKDPNYWTLRGTALLCNTD